MRYLLGVVLALSIVGVTNGQCVNGRCQNSIVTGQPVRNSVRVTARVVTAPVRVLKAIVVNKPIIRRGLFNGRIRGNCCH